MGPDATYQCNGRFIALCNKHDGRWRVRKHATGGYNCAGMVWSSRRSVLPRPSDWRLILSEDGYRPLVNGEPSEVGDIVVYVKKNDTEILHVARVCEMESLTVSGLGERSPNRIPRALSKWDGTSGECIHAINDVHLNGGEPFDPVIFTDRPSQGAEGASNG